MPETLSPSQVAARIGIAVPSVYRWIDSGKIPAHAVERAPNGTITISPHGLIGLRKHCQRRNDGLSAREIEVLRLAVDEKTYHEVAKILNLSVKTVDAHLRNIRIKLNCHCIAGLVRYAVRTGLIDA